MTYPPSPAYSLPTLVIYSMQKAIFVLGLILFIGVPVSQAQSSDSLNARFDNAHQEREAFRSLIQADEDANTIRRARYRKFQKQKEQELLSGETKRLTTAQRIHALRTQRQARINAEQSIADRIAALKAKIAEQAATVVPAEIEVDPSVFSPLPVAALQAEADRAAKKRADLRRLQRIQESRVGRFSRSKPLGGLSRFKSLRREAFKREIRNR